MREPKPVSLHVRPYQVSHLCFEAGGVLEDVAIGQLGAQAKAFDFPAFYAILGGTPTVAGDPSRLLYDFLKIKSATAPFALASLRTEPRKAALSNAINARQNAYFAKYANAPAIIGLMNQFYSPSIVGSKPQRLDVLSTLANAQFAELKAAYTADGRLGVVKTTGSVLNAVTESTGESSGASTSQTQASGSTNEEALTGPIAEPATLGSLPPGGGSMAGTTYSGGTTPATELVEEGTSGETAQSSGSDYTRSASSATQSQTIVNTDYGYRVPYLESAAQLERAQISLMDQQFAQFMYGQNLPHLAQVFQNELNSIDSNVFRLQIALLNTILMSPIAGTITGIYKNPGDAVRAGEPVVRVEDNSTIFLLATVIYPGPIVIAPPGVLPPANSTVTVKTHLFDSSGPLTKLSGSIVSARGQRDDEKWDLVVKCNNLDGSGNPIFPLGYHFDYDDTTVSIT